MDDSTVAENITVNVTVVADTAQADAQLEESSKKARNVGMAAANGFKAVTAGLDSMVAGLVHGTKNMQQVVKQGVDTMVIDFLKGQIKMEMAAIQSHLGITGSSIAANRASLVDFLFTGDAKVGAAQAVSASVAESQTTAAAVGGAAEGVSAKKSISTHAGSAAAAVYDSVSQIPLIGWLLAPAAAGTAYAAVSAFSGMIPGFEVGAWEIPKTMLAMLHPGESVVPANFASGLRASGVLAGGGSMASPPPGDTHVHFNVSAVDGAGVAAFFKEHATTIARSVTTAQARNPSLRPGY